MIVIMKFKGKKFISIVLAALMVVSVFVVGTVSAGATANWTMNGTPYIYFNNSNTDWTLGNIRLFVVTSDTVYSNKFTGGVSNNTSLRYLNPKSLFAGKTIDFISFVQITSSANSGDLKNNTSFSRDLVYDSNGDVISNPSYIDGYNYTLNYSDGVSSESNSYTIFSPSSLFTSAILKILFVLKCLDLKVILYESSFSSS